MPRRPKKKSNKNKKKKTKHPHPKQTNKTKRKVSPSQILNKEEYDYFIKKIGFTDNTNPNHELISIKQIYHTLVPHFGLNYSIPMNYQPISAQLIDDLRNKINGLYTNKMTESYYNSMSLRLKKLTQKYGKGAFHFLYKNPKDFINKKLYNIKTSFLWYHLSKTNQCHSCWLFGDYFVWLPLPIMKQFGFVNDSNLFDYYSSIYYVINQVIFTNWPYNRNMVVEIGPYIHPTLDTKICNKLRTFFKNEKWSTRSFQKRFPDITKMVKMDQRNKKLIHFIASNIMDGDGYYYNKNKEKIDIWMKYEKQGKKLCDILFSKRLLRFIDDVMDNTYKDCIPYEFLKNIINICNSNSFVWRVIGLIIDNDIDCERFSCMNDLEKFMFIFEGVKYFPDLDFVFEIAVKIIGLKVYTNIMINTKTEIGIKASKLEERILGVKCKNEKCKKNQNDGEIFKMCSQCKCVWYCTVMCQKMDWMQHRFSCQ